MSLVTTGAVQIGQSATSSNNFHWRNNLLGGIRLSRGNSGSITGGDDPSDVIRVRVTNAVEFPGGVASGVLGAGQTHQDVTASRAAGTTYTNTSVVAREVEVIFTSTLAGQVAIVPTVNGVSLGLTTTYVSTTNFNVSRKFIVPAGATYSVSTSGSSSTPTLSKWTELS